MSDSSQSTYWMVLIIVGINANATFALTDSLLSPEVFAAMGYLLLTGVVIGQRIMAHRTRSQSLAAYYLADTLNVIRDLLAVTFVGLVLLTTGQMFGIAATPSEWLPTLGGVGLGLGLVALVQMVAQLAHRGRQLARTS